MIVVVVIIYMWQRQRLRAGTAKTQGGVEQHDDDEETPAPNVNEKTPDSDEKTPFSLQHDDHVNTSYPSQSTSSDGSTPTALTPLMKN
jgi:hypothetical protein